MNGCVPSLLSTQVIQWMPTKQPTAACLPTVGGNLLLANKRGAELPAEPSQCPCSFRRQHEWLTDTRTMYSHSWAASTLRYTHKHVNKYTSTHLRKYLVHNWVQACKRWWNRAPHSPLPSVWSVFWQIEIQTIAVVSGWKWSHIAKWLNQWNWNPMTLWTVWMPLSGSVLGLLQDRNARAVSSNKIQ